MKIVYFTDFLLPSNTGVATSLINLSSKLTSYGHKITIIAPKNKNESLERFRHEKFSVRFTPSISGEMIYPDFRFGIPMTPKIIKEIRELKPDIIHFHTLYLMGGGAILLGKLLKKPIIGTSHGYFMDPDFLDLVNIKQSKKQISQLLWKYTKFFFNQCDEVTVPAAVMKMDLKKHGITSNIRIIANTINEKNVAPISPSAVAMLKAKLGLGDQTLLYVGRLSKEKSIDTLLKSFHLVLQRLPKAQLVIIGDGPENQTLKSLCRELGITKSVIFLEEIAQQELLTKGYYQIAEAFVTASITEVQPVTFIEAFYFGLPIVGVAKKGAKEMLVNVGLLAKPNDIVALADHFVDVLLDKQLRLRLSKKSREAYLAHHDADKIAKSFEKLYKDVLASKRRRLQNNDE